MMMNHVASLFAVELFVRRRERLCWFCFGANKIQRERQESTRPTKNGEKEEIICHMRISKAKSTLYLRGFHVSPDIYHHLTLKSKHMFWYGIEIRGILDDIKTALPHTNGLWLWIGFL